MNTPNCVRYGVLINFLNRTCAIGAPGCITFMVRVKPPPLTVIVPLRAEELVFAVTLTVTLPLFDPEAGDTVIHEYEPRVTVQLTEEVISKYLDCALLLLKISSVGDTSKLIPGCVTVTVLSVTPAALNVTVPVRDEPELAGALTVTEPLFEPEVGETVSHEAELLAVQLVFEVTLIVSCDSEVANVIVPEGDTVNVGALCVTVTFTVSADLATILIVAFLCEEVVFLSTLITSWLLSFEQLSHEGGVV